MCKKLLLLILFLLSFNIVSSYTDPILYYTFDKQTGNVLKDSSVNNHDAFLEGSTLRIDNSRILKGLYFDGSNSTFKIPYSNNININDSFTFSMWIYINRTKIFQGIISKSNLKARNGFVFGQTNTDLVLNINSGKNQTRFKYNFYDSKYHTGWNFPFREWIYLSITYNGTNIKSYVNGKIINDLSVTETNIYNIEDYIVGYGIDADYRENYFQGYIDEFRVYNYSLDNHSLSELYFYSFYPDINDTENPTKPINLRTNNIGRYSLNFSWDASTDDVGVLGYRIYRDGKFLENVLTTNYFDSNLNASTNYTYQVVAYDTSNKNSTSALIKIQTNTKGNLYFFDNFETGDLSKTNLDGFYWGNNGKNVNNDNSYEGNYSLKFFYKGSGNALKHSFSEQRFFLGDKYKNLWFKYYLFLPSNYYQRQPGILRISDSTNNFIIGEKIYKDGGRLRDVAVIKDFNQSEIFVEGLQGNYNFLNPFPYNVTSESGAKATVQEVTSISSNDKGLVFLWNHNYSGIAHTGLNHWPVRGLYDGSAYLTISRKRNGSFTLHTDHNLSTIIFNTSSDLGKWIEFIVHIKLSEPEVNNGVVEVWKNGNKFYEIYNLDNWQQEPNNYLDKGYLLGWANGGFYENTTLYIDNFEVSTNPLTSSYIQDTELPTIPTNLQTINITNTSIKFNWTKSQDNVAIFEYEIYRNSVLVKTTSNNYYTLSNLQANTTYNIEIRALDSSNNPSNLSLPLVVKTLENSEGIIIIPLPLTSCGNDTIEGTEVCDGTDLNGTTCQSLGFDKGTLSCKTDCTGYITSSCSNDKNTGGSNTGGGGGGSSFCYSCIEDINIINTCIPLYQYSEWSDCIDNMQARYVEDINNCEGDEYEQRSCQIDLSEEENLILNAKLLTLNNYANKKYKTSLDSGYNEIFYVEEQLEDNIFLLQDEATGREYYGQYYDTIEDKYYYTLKRVDAGYITILQDEGILGASFGGDESSENSLLTYLVIGFVIILFVGSLGYAAYYIKKMKMNQDSL